MQEALHPIRRTAPDLSRYTRSEEVQCLQIVCSASHNKHNHGQFLPTEPNRPPRTQRHSFDMLTPAPNERRCTRYVALHPLRSDAPDQKGCNAYRSGAPPPTTSPTAGNSAPQPQPSASDAATHPRNARQCSSAAIKETSRDREAHARHNATHRSTHQLLGHSNTARTAGRFYQHTHTN